MTVVLLFFGRFYNMLPMGVEDPEFLAGFLKRPSEMWAGELMMHLKNGIILVYRAMCRTKEYLAK